MLSIVVLSKFKDIFEPFRQLCDQHIPDYQKVLVRDGNSISDPGKGWIVVQGPERFSMAGNANLGWRSVEPTHDILYIGDDVRFTRIVPLRLERQANGDERIGILSPKIVGPCCNPLQNDPPLGVTYSKRSLAFICIYVKRTLIDKVGYLDEQFCNYGFDDNDYCLRTQLAGFELGVTGDTFVHHVGHATFKRGPWISDGEQKFRNKWGDRAATRTAQGS